MNFTGIPIISSRDNARLKRARAVRDGRERGMIFVEGTRLASELSKSSLSVESLFISEAFVERDFGLLERIAGNGTVEVHRVAEKIFTSITDTDNPQGIVVLARRPDSGDLQGHFRVTELAVFLNKINNPSNLGAVIRTAEAAGVSAVITSPGSADAFSPKALRASMGSAFRMPVIADIPFEDLMELAKSGGIRTVGADINGNRNYTDLDWRGGAVLVLGAEAHGLEPSELAQLDLSVVIPMENDVESLNLAVSAGIILFEAKRQRDRKLND